MAEETQNSSKKTPDKKDDDIVLSKEEIKEAKRLINSLTKNNKRKIYAVELIEGSTNAMQNLSSRVSAVNPALMAASYITMAANNIFSLTGGYIVNYETKKINLQTDRYSQEDFNNQFRNERVIANPEELTQYANRLSESATSYVREKGRLYRAFGTFLFSLGAMSIATSDLTVLGCALGTTAVTQCSNYFFSKRATSLRVDYKKASDSKDFQYKTISRKMREMSTQIEASKMQKIAYQQLENRAKESLSTQKAFSKKLALNSFLLCCVNYAIPAVVAAGTYLHTGSLAVATTIATGSIFVSSASHQIITGFMGMKEYIKNFAHAYRNLKSKFKNITFGTESLKENANVIRLENIAYHHHTKEGNREDKQLFASNKTFAFEKGISILSGASGAGKSSLIELILQGDFVTDGSIKIGTLDKNNKFHGQNYRDLAQNEVLKNIAFSVPPVMIDIPINEYITLGTQASSEQIQKIKDLCGIGPDTDQIDENKKLSAGTKLSAGELQRISLARTLLLDTPIMIFDEALSNIDAGRREKIIDHLNELGKDKTIIYITHNSKDIDSINAYQAIDIGIHSENQTVNDIKRFDLSTQPSRRKYSYFFAKRQESEESMEVAKEEHLTEIKDRIKERQTVLSELSKKEISDNPAPLSKKKQKALHYPKNKKKNPSTKKHANER